MSHSEYFHLSRSMSVLVKRRGEELLFVCIDPVMA